MSCESKVGCYVLSVGCWVLGGGRDGRSVESKTYNFSLGFGFGVGNPENEQPPQVGTVMGDGNKATTAHGRAQEAAGSERATSPRR